MLTIQRYGFADSFSLTTREAVDLEVKLNETTRGHELAFIGDSLYNFYQTGGKANQTLNLNTDQYRYLQALR